MLTEEANRRLTQVAAGTPGGDLLRRYWHPLFPAQWLTTHEPTRITKVLGESLVIFQDTEGGYGAFPERCPHRGASLGYGFVEDGGLRCSYHGWLFSRDGRCLETPFEPHKNAMEISIRAYPVRERAGLLFIYLGPQLTEPHLPNWDILARTHGSYSIQIQKDLRCNWLQIQENAADVTHTTFLHSYRLHKMGLVDNTGFGIPMRRYGFQPFEWGLVKSWVYEEGGQQKEGWGNLLIFPNMLRLETEMHWRVPVDDTTTRIIILGYEPTSQPRSVDVVWLPPRERNGKYTLDTFYSQDAMAWETAGAIFDRRFEHLGASDVGISMFRRMLLLQLDLIEQGREPDIGLAPDESTIDLREWMGGYLPMSAPRDPTVTRRRPREQIFDERHRTFEVPDGKARHSWQR